MISSDRPIQKRDEDALSRRNFSEYLAKSLMNYSDPDCLVVGLYGKWGHGKTSILNMIEDYYHSNKNNSPIIVKFNPWYFSDQNQLFTQFFKALATTIKVSDTWKDGENIAEKLIAYSLCFTAVAPVFASSPNAPWLFALVASTFTSVSQALAAISRIKKQSIEDLKSAISEKLSKHDRKIVVIIDDIDRLPASEIRQMFQLIKHVANFKNVVYLVAFDRDVVVRSLEDVQVGNGSEYLEKIIQVQFEIPSINEKSISKYLESKLDPILETCPRHDEKYLSVLYYFSLRSMLVSLRRVNLLINRFHLGIEQAREFVQPDEFFAITALQVFYHEIFLFIKTNGHLFYGQFSDSRYSIDGNTKEETKRILDPVFSTLPSTDREIVVGLLSELFPKVKALYDKPKYGPEKGRKDCAISTSEHFQGYFSFSIDEDSLPVTQIEIALESSSDVTTFESHLVQIVSSGKISQFLERLLDYIKDDIPQENIPQIISGLMNLGDTFPSDRKEEFFSIDNTMRLLRIFYQVSLKIEDKEKRFEVFRDAVSYARKSIYTLVHEIAVQGQQHGKFASNGPSPEHQQTVTFERLGELEAMACQKIEEWLLDHNLFDHPKCAGILFPWKSWAGAERVHKYVHDLTRETLGLVKFVTAFMFDVRTSSGNYKAIKPKDVAEYGISEEIIASRLRDIRYNDSIGGVAFSEDNKKAISLFLDTHDGKIRERF